VSKKKKQFKIETNRTRAAKNNLRAREDRLGPEGFFGTHLREAKPTYNALSCDKIVEGESNASIVLGRDRNASERSGGAGPGFTGCAAIDLVVGRSSAYKKITGEPGAPDERVLVNPNFAADAARIYITQKGNIDDYLGLTKGSEPKKSSRSRSAVGIKADHVRIVGRNHIKIVTGRSQLEGGGRWGERNSQGGKIETTGRIDLIAGNYTSPKNDRSRLWSGKMRRFKTPNVLQPIPKGDNLVECIKEIVEILYDIVGDANSTKRALNKLASYVGSHQHEAVVPLPSGQIIALPSPSLAGQCASFCVKRIPNAVEGRFLNYNLGVFKINYLSKYSPKYINSRHVNTT